MGLASIQTYEAFWTVNPCVSAYSAFERAREGCALDNTPICVKRGACRLEIHLQEVDTMLFYAGQPIIISSSLADFTHPLSSRAVGLK